MAWSPRGAFAVAALLGLCALSAAAQTPPAKGGDATKKETPKAKLPLDKIKLPSGSVLVITDDVREGLSLIPRMVVLTPEQYQELQERVAALEKQLRVDKKPAGACKLTGKLDGNEVALKAEFAFSTEQPRMTVVLGLKGAHLTDEGHLDRQTPLLDFGDEGFVVRVEKEGNHQLTLSLRVPVETKKAAGAERGFEVELPGAAVTTLSLELPPNIKEIRCNDKLCRERAGGRWQPALDRSKKLTVSWREPVVLPGVGPLPSVEGTLDVRLNETHVLIKADLALEDLRGQTREWQLLLPPQASLDVTNAPGGSSYELVPPDGKNPHHLLRLAEANSERWGLSALVRLPRPAPGARLPIGPFYVENAYRQQGTIKVQAAPEALQGQRLVYHRTGEVFQRDLPKTAAGPELDAVFQYWNLHVPGKKQGAVKVPLELEVRNEKGQVKTRAEHELKLRPTPDGWEVDLRTRLTAQSLLTASDALDVQLPVPRPRGTAVLGLAPLTSYPAGLPWLALWESQPGSVTRGLVGEFQAHTEEGGALDLTPLDGQGRARLTWPRHLGNKPFVAVLTTKYVFPRAQQRFRVDLPRPLGALEREARLTVRADERLELLIGPPGAEEPVPDRHTYQAAWDQSPGFVDLSWRRYRPELVVDAVADVTVHERSAQVRQRLAFKLPPQAEAPGGQVRLDVPPAVRRLTVSGARLDRHDAKGHLAWVVLGRPLTDAQEFTVSYDLDLPRREADDRPGARQLALPLVWPQGTTAKAAKLRVWARPGTLVAPADELLRESPWKDRGLEVVPGHADLPALVLQAGGQDVSLRLRLEEASAPALAALLCDRALLRVEVDEDRGQLCRARYLVRKVSADHLDVEFPVPVAECLQSVTLAGRGLAWGAAAWNVARVPLQPDLYDGPVVLDLVYRLPPAFFADKGPWRTPVHPPAFRPDVLIARQRWAVTLAPGAVGVVPGKGVVLDSTWDVQNWLLTPRPSVSSDDLDAWLTGKETVDGSARDLSLVFEQLPQGPVQVYHLPWKLWLLVCSGVLLLAAIALIFVPLPRALVVGTLVLGGLGLLTVGLLWPALLPALAYGCEPGVLILLLILVAHWLVQERYRRQVVFMPGFARGSKSSLSRGSQNQRPREASTVDAPAPSGVLGAGGAGSHTT